jgi:hypothetical protein
MMMVTRSLRVSIFLLFAIFAIAAEAIYRSALSLKID